MICFHMLCYRPAMVAEWANVSTQIQVGLLRSLQVKIPLGVLQKYNSVGIVDWLWWSSSLRSLYCEFYALGLRFESRLGHKHLNGTIAIIIN